MQKFRVRPTLLKVSSTTYGLPNSYSLVIFLYVRVS